VALLFKFDQQAMSSPDALNGYPIGIPQIMSPQSTMNQGTKREPFTKPDATRRPEDGQGTHISCSLCKGVGRWMERCCRCDGRGTVILENTECTTCSGTGGIAEKDNDPATCLDCRGKGRVDLNIACLSCNAKPRQVVECSNCGGTGWILLLSPKDPPRDPQQRRFSYSEYWR
jgi:DnaJ-class molecular chaperone